MGCAVTKVLLSSCSAEPIILTISWGIFMRRSTIALSILLSPILLGQPAWLSAQGSHLSKSAKTVTPTQSPTAHISVPSNHPSTPSTQYSFNFTDPNTAPTLGGNWVRAEELTVQNGTVVYAHFVFAQPGTAPLISAVQQQYGQPKVSGNLASWTSGDNNITVSGAESLPSLTIENKLFTSTHR
jgi:hypothetical protein